MFFTNLNQSKGHSNTRWSKAFALFFVWNLMVAVWGQPNPPSSITSSRIYSCSGADVQLTANDPDGTVYWFSGSCGGTLIGTGNTIVVNPTTTTTYFARNLNGGVFSSTCASYQIPVGNLLAPPVSGATQLNCGNSTQLTSATGANTLWYDAAVGGNLIGTGASITVTPTQTTTYYAEDVGNVSNSVTFNYSGSEQDWIVPAGVTNIRVEVYGAQGSRDNNNYSQGGLGGIVTANVNVVPGSTLKLHVGNQPAFNSSAFNGGACGAGCSGYYGGGGGGASDIRMGGNAITDRVIVAGGGGGAGYNGNYNNTGGAGGGTQGADGFYNGYVDGSYSGRGGTQISGGNGINGSSSGSLGNGGSAYYYYGGGGGGGGYYGGSGGYYYGAGGGGSSYAHPTHTQNVVHTQGGNLGNGKIIIYYNVPICSSPRTGHQIIANVPAAPTLSGVTSVLCGSTTTLSASSGANTVWYADAQQNQLLGIGADLTVSPQTNTRYYASEVTINTVNQSFSYTGNPETWVVPAGVFEVEITANGAQGGNSSYGTGGAGGRVYTKLAVTPGQTLYVNVGSQPTSCCSGGYNGGGSTNGNSGSNGGGGATDVRINSNNYSDVVVVAGAGGGAGGYWNCSGQNGGAGGGATAAQDGWYCGGPNGSVAGYGGSQTTGGNGSSNGGSAGYNGYGGSPSYYGGAGGGGWYGGGGGYYGGGGGGSSYAKPAVTNSTVHTQGANTGNGSLTISYKTLTCQSNLDSIDVQVTTPLAPTITGNTSAQCGSVITLTSSSGANTVWYQNGVAIGTGATIDVTPDTTTTYTAKEASINLSSRTFAFNASSYTWTVPAGVTSIQFDVVGAQGGNSSYGYGGYGGRVQGTLAVTPGQTLYFTPGGQPSGCCTGGYNGGGNGSSGSGYTSGGGGASDIRINGNGLTDRVVVAGAGGGAGYNCGSYSNHGGAGGGASQAGNGLNCSSYSSSNNGSGATPSGGGVNASNGGSPGTLGQGGNGSYYGGGGGAGYYGGGGSYYGGGGGGSSFTSPSLASNVNHTQGHNSNGNGYIQISFDSISCAGAAASHTISIQKAAAPSISGTTSVSCGNSTTLSSSAGANTVWYSDSTLTTILGVGQDLTLHVDTTTSVWAVEGVLDLVSQNFTYTGSTISYTVPTNVSAIQFTLTGAQGGNASYGTGGYGGSVAGVLSVQPGQQLQFNLGGQPNCCGGGFNGGGSGTGNNSAAGGGGASDIRIAPFGLTNRLVVAGGGGGGGGYWNCYGQNGGAGGGSATAQDGLYCSSYNNGVAGMGGSQSNGGNGSSNGGGYGALGQGGSGSYYGGAGGGGYYGGGGGYYGGGGGGSSFANPMFTSSISHTQGAQSGHGTLAINYLAISCEGTPTKVTVQSVLPSAPSVTGSTTLSCGTPVNLTSSASSGTIWSALSSGANVIDTGVVFNELLTQSDTIYVSTGRYANVSTTFNYNGSSQSWTVPAGVYEIEVDVIGAQGGSGSYGYGGYGGRVTGKLQVTPGEILQINVGQQPTSCCTGGFNGGGNGSSSSGYTLGGGGASDIRKNGTSLNERVIVAGGGGGSGYNCSSYNNHGGAGGGSGQAGNGINCSSYNPSNNGAGATPTNGGANAYNGGQPGSFGQGGYASNYGGGGGGGYYGGGGSYYGGGGGGSSFTDPALVSNVVHTQGHQTGNGVVVIRYESLACMSPVVPVPVTINQLPAPVVANDSIFCSGSKTLTATSPGINVWFDMPSGGSPLDTGATFTTPNLTATQNYYVERVASYTGGVGTCPSVRTLVEVFVGPPVAPLAVSDTICNNTQTTLVASGSNVGNYVWYYLSAGGPMLTTGNSYTTPNLSQPTTYWVEADAGNGCVSARAPLTVEIDPTVLTFNPMPVICQNSAHLQVVGASPAGGVYSGTGIANGVFDPVIAGVGQHMVSYTYTSNPGCVYGINEFITVDPDITNPQFTFIPNDTIVNNTLGSCGANVTWVTPTATDDCAFDTLISSYANNAFIAVGVDSVRLTARDKTGNQVRSGFTITVNDVEQPIFTSTHTNLVVVNTTGQCGANVSWATPAATDNCTLANLVSSHLNNSYFAVGTDTVTLTATDAANNNTILRFAVDVSDAEMPTLASMPNDTVLIAASGQCSTAFTWVAPTGNDNCGVASLTASHTAGSIFNVGDSYVSYRIEDVHGNIVVDSFKVSVIETDAPTLANVPSNITVNTDANSCMATVNWNAPTATDACGSASVVSSRNSGSTFNVGVNTVYITATDLFGNTAVDSFTVTVNDVELPTFTNFPTDIIAQAPLNACGANVTWVTPGAVDNCSATVTSSDVSGTFYAVGQHAVTFTATDAYGNTTTQVLQIQVIDVEQPVFTTCPTDITVCEGDTVHFAAPAAMDNCSIQSINQTAGQASGTVFPIGTHSVSFTAYDNGGNQTNCSFTVIVGAKPIASFTAPDNCTGQEVVFANNSSGATSYNWNFGDISASSMAAPTHAYTQSGSYAVQLIATSALGCADTSIQTIAIGNSPDAAYIVAQQAGTSFTFQPLFQPSGATYLWNFGDSTSSTAINPSKTYATPGVREVCLTVTENGCASTYCAYQLVEFTSVSDPMAFKTVLYPNPTHSQFVIDVTTQVSQDVQIHIFDMFGKLITQQTHVQQAPGLHTYRFDTESLNMAQGTYLVKIKTAQFEQVLRVVVVK